MLLGSLRSKSAVERRFESTKQCRGKARCHDRVWTGENAPTLQNIRVVQQLAGDIKRARLHVLLW